MRIIKCRIWNYRITHITINGNENQVEFFIMASETKSLDSFVKKG
jgi:hypothetical protein